MADNQLFIFKSGRVECITLGIGSRESSRRITMSDDEGLKLAYRLMSLCSGGETKGVEQFDVKP